MELIGEVDLQVKVGKLCCLQRFVVVPSLIERCVLGVDFLVLHRVTFDFSTKNVTGPELGVVNTKKKSVITMCQKHTKLTISITHKYVIQLKALVSIDISLL